MSTVVQFDPDKRAAERLSADAQGLAGGGGPPHDGDMEARVSKLEEAVSDIRERLARIEAKTDGVVGHGATKADMQTLRADLSSMETRMTRWFVGTAVAMSAAVAAVAFAIARFIGN